MKHSFTLLFFLFAITLSAQEELQKLSFDVAKISTKPNSQSVILTITSPKEYHLYGNPLGPGVGKPTTITPLQSDAITWISATTIPTEKFIPEGFEEEWVWSWHGDIPFVFDVTVKNPTAPLTLIVDGLICKTACIPVKDTITFLWDTLPEYTNQKAIEQASVPFPLVGVNNPIKSVKQEVPSTDTSSSLALWWALILAFLAGIILNVMPCVLPVLGIKILALSENSAGSKKNTLLHSLSFASGMLSVFLLLATVAVLIIQAGNSWSWGQQFQSSIFTIGIIAVIFLFSLGMFDLFIILVPSKFGELDQKASNEKMWGSFFKGAFATILATPCSGPLLGGVLAWALTGQSPLVIYSIFGAVGVGMATPYIILASSRRLVRLIPKPGMWMEDFKHFLGFLMLGFAIWLLQALPQSQIIPTLGLLLTLTAALMVYLRTAPFGSTLARKAVTLLGILIVVSAITLLLFKHETQTVWEPFNEALFSEALQNNESVIIDFTASWCMNCQSNKALVYQTSEVLSLIATKNVRAFRADLTNSNPEAEKYRDQFGSKSVPFLVIIPQGDTTKIIQHRDIVSKSAFINDINALK